MLTRAIRGTARVPAHDAAGLARVTRSRADRRADKHPDATLAPADAGAGQATALRAGHVADLVLRFLAAGSGGLDQAIVEGLRRIVEDLRFDWAALWLKAGPDTDAVCTHSWPESRPACSVVRELVAVPAIASRLDTGEACWFTDIDATLGPADRDRLRRLGVRSGAFVPLRMPGEGAAVRRGLVASRSREHGWSAATIEQLRVVGLMARHLLERQASVDQLHATVKALEREREDGQRALETAHAQLKTLRDRLDAGTAERHRQPRNLPRLPLLVTESTAARQVLAQIEQVAPTTATVLMLGETGSGKEVFAEALHELSPRRHKPMIRVNCAAIPTALIESELFGRERGAYTGALSRQIGRFEAADGSTLFLDEVGELPAEVQVKLLRVLQERVIERLGSSQPIKVNVRVIAATNRNLEQAVADRSFREDLYYRLNVFPIRVPPLRERVEDIPSLAWSFIDEFSAAFGRHIESLSKDSLRVLLAHTWPGNVRELRNTIERAVILAKESPLVVEPSRPASFGQRKSLALIDIETDHIRSVLAATSWRVRGRGGAANLLGMKPTTLESRMARLGIVREGSYRRVTATPAAELG